MPSQKREKRKTCLFPSPRVFPSIHSSGRKQKAHPIICLLCTPVLQTLIVPALTDICFSVELGWMSLFAILEALKERPGKRGGGEVDVTGSLAKRVRGVSLKENGVR